MSKDKKKEMMQDYKRGRSDAIKGNACEDEALTAYYAGFMSIEGGLNLTIEECITLGGHCFVESNEILTTIPPQFKRVCKHCGFTQVGSSQPNVIWRNE